MKILELIRLEESEEGTIGVLKIDKQVFCVTMEPPDRLNERNRSSIPTGQYEIKRHQSPKYGETFQVMDVTGRDNVLFHAGNTVDHTKGCILVAEHVGKLRGDRAVLNSGNTFRRFMAALENEEVCHLTISDDY